MLKLLGWDGFRAREEAWVKHFYKSEDLSSNPRNHIKVRGDRSPETCGTVSLEYTVVNNEDLAFV